MNKINTRELLIWAAILLVSGAIAYSVSGQHEHEHAGAVGAPVGAITMNTTEGASVDLEAQTGRTVILNVYATWCPPCRAEIPDLSAFNKEVKGAGEPVDLYGVVFESGPVKEADAASREMGIDYPILMGTQALIERFGLHSYPTTIVIDPEGNVTHHIEGVVHQQQLQSLARLD